MSRAQRLLDLIQVLRRHRRPVSGTALAETMGISLRTLYRDVETLKAQGAHIDGEAGVGFVLRPGFMLPPMMFTEDEIEALVLGSQWVAERGDATLGVAARNALAKIGAVLPEDLKSGLEANHFMFAPCQAPAIGDTELTALRAAIRTEHKVRIAYADGAGVTTKRTIWPFAIAFFDQKRIVAAWCELRADFRHFRTDRISSLKTLQGRLPKRRHALLKEWRLKEGIGEQ